MTRVNSLALLFDADYPAEGDVRQGTNYGDPANALTGTLIVGGGNPSYPAQGDVRSGIQYGTEGSPEFTGTLDLPSINDVRLNVAFDNTTKMGNVRLPQENQVVDGVLYDSLDSREGTFQCPTGGVAVFPPATDVRTGVQYGDEGVLQFTGTAAIPLPADVRETVPVDATSGTVHIPPITRVELGYVYDAPSQPLTGQLDCGFTGDSPEWVG